MTLIDFFDAGIAPVWFRPTRGSSIVESQGGGLLNRKRSLAES